MLIEQANVDRAALKDRVAVVTGAGQGIGQETAKALAYLGASVVIAEISDSGRETEEVIRDAGGQALFVRTDVADPESMDLLRQEVLARFGEVDILINNAEVNTAKAVLDHSVEEWDRVLAVNLRGGFLGIKTFLPAMLARRAGVVITMESAEGMPYMSAYLASKVGIRSLTMSLAQEIGENSGVSVYCFGPGIVDTPGANAAFRQLAPLYGLTVEQFIAQAGMELVSAELCATGLVGTILQAGELHGQETAYAVGLVKLGLAPGRSGATGTEPEATLPTSPQEPGTSTDVAARAGELNRQVVEILRTVARETAELSMFQCPIVRRMFQQGTGLKIEDWIASAEEMSKDLENRASAGGVRGPQALDRYVAQLRKLATYFGKQEADARGWFKDPEKLDMALAALAERKTAVSDLISVLSGA